MHIYPHFLRFFVCIGHNKVLCRVPSASRSLLVIYFIYNSLHMSIPISQFILPQLTFPSDNYKFNFYICNSTSLLWISSIVSIFLDSMYNKFHCSSFFRFHTITYIWYLYHASFLCGICLPLPNLLHSAWLSPDPSILLQIALFC